MIFRCTCGRLKNGKPYRSSGEMSWLCEVCSPAKRSNEASKAAQERHDGKSYPSQIDRRAAIGR